MYKIQLVNAMDKNKKGPVGKTAQQYSESTTIHGIQYIFENDKFMFDRILWILIVICGIFFAVYLSVLAHVEWKNNPVLTTVATTGFPIEKIDFPAITICAQVCYLTILIIIQIIIVHISIIEIL